MRTWPLVLLPVALLIAATPFIPSLDGSAGGPGAAQGRPTASATAPTTATASPAAQTTLPAAP